MAVLDRTRRRRQRARRCLSRRSRRGPRSRRTGAPRERGSLFRRCASPRRRARGQGIARVSSFTHRRHRQRPFGHAETGRRQQPAREHGFGKGRGHGMPARADQQRQRIGHLQAGAAGTLGDQRGGVAGIGQRAPQRLRKLAAVGAAHGFRTAMLLEKAFSGLADEVARLAHGNGILSRNAAAPRHSRHRDRAEPVRPLLRRDPRPPRRRRDQGRAARRRRRYARLGPAVPGGRRHVVPRGQPRQALGRGGPEGCRPGSRACAS